MRRAGEKREGGEAQAAKRPEVYANLWSRRMRASRAAPAGWGLKCARDAGPRRWPATLAGDERPPARRGGSKQSGGIYSGAGLCEGDASHVARSPSGGLDGAAWELPSFCCGREWCMVSRKRRARETEDGGMPRFVITECRRAVACRRIGAKRTRRRLLDAACGATCAAHRRTQLPSSLSVQRNVTGEIGFRVHRVLFGRFSSQSII